MDAFIKDGVAIVTLPERLDQETGHALADMLEKSVSAGQLQFLLDARGLKYIGSFGISVLLRKTRDIQSAGGDLRIRNLVDQPASVVRDTGMDAVLSVEMESEELEPQQARPGEIAEKEAGDALILSLKGAWYFPEGTRRLRQALQSLPDDCRKLVLDFTELKYLDSQCVNEVLNVNYRIRRNNGQTRICKANPIVAEMLDTVNISSVIQVFDTLEQALEA